MHDDINALRVELFATLRALRDPQKTIDVETARAVVEVGKAIIDSARVEVEMARFTGQQCGSGFMPLAAPPATANATLSSTTVTNIPGGRVIRHELKD